MTFKAYLRKNFPRVRQECRRAALDSCKDQYTDAILLWIACWADLLQITGNTIEDWGSFVSRFCALMRGESIFALIKKCNDFDDTITHTISRYDFYQEVADAKLGIPYYKGIAEFAKSKMDTSFLFRQEEDFVRCYRTCLLFLKRLRGPGLLEQSCSAWHSINNYTADHCWAPQPVGGYSKDISFPRVQLTTGSVADVPGTFGKQGLKAKASCTLAKADWKTATKFDLVWPPSMMYAQRRIVGDATSIVLAVPKNFKTDRFITKEPAAQAWMQRRVGTILRNFVKSWSEGRCDPEDASLNRWLICQKGWSTIDLTSASDTVHKDWINQIPWMELRRAIWASRTPYAVVDGTRVPTAMAAGMGCGWTFPLECFVFSTIAKSICGNDYAVYGDDIVVPDSCYDSMITLLDDFGFIPNLEKSFTEPYCFRESCGLHVFHWESCVDASPAYYPGRFTTTSIEQSPENFIGLQRESTYYGMESTAYVISREIEKHVPFSDYWESQLPWSPNGAAEPDPVWGTYSLPSTRAKRYLVADLDRFPFALLQDYLDDECWDPAYPWIRKALTTENLENEKSRSQRTFGKYALKQPAKGL